MLRKMAAKALGVENTLKHNTKELFSRINTNKTPVAFNFVFLALGAEKTLKHNIKENIQQDKYK